MLKNTNSIPSGLSLATECHVKLHNRISRISSLSFFLTFDVSLYCLLFLFLIISFNILLFACFSVIITLFCLYECLIVFVFLSLSLSLWMSLSVSTYVCVSLFYLVPQCMCLSSLFVFVIASFVSILISPYF